jgi:hypothetical protein
MDILRPSILTSFALAALSACGQPPRAELLGRAPEAPATAVAAAPQIIASVESPAPSSTATPSATAVLSATAGPEHPRPRLPKVSTSPGKIECATVECDLRTELCCQDHDTGRCVSLDDKAGCGSKNVLWKRCDESADCGKGEVCCYSPRPDPETIAENLCRKGGCVDPDMEICLAGGRCRNGQRCRLLDKDQYDGWCPGGMRSR